MGKSKSNVKIKLKFSKISGSRGARTRRVMLTTLHTQGHRTGPDLEDGSGMGARIDRLVLLGQKGGPVITRCADLEI